MAEAVAVTVILLVVFDVVNDNFGAVASNLNDELTFYEDRFPATSLIPDFIHK